MLDLITGIYKTDEWRDYVTRGAGTFDLSTVKNVFNAPYKYSNGEIDMTALRNKAIAMTMILFGAHPMDMYKIMEEDVIDRPDHVDREGCHRPKIIVKGVHTKRPWNVDNVIGCGCLGDHNEANPNCVYGVVKSYNSHRIR